MKHLENLDINEQTLSNIKRSFGPNNFTSVLIANNECSFKLNDYLALPEEDYIPINGHAVFNLKEVLKGANFTSIEEYLTRVGYKGKIVPVSVRGLTDQENYNVSAFYYDVMASDENISKRQYVFTHDNCLDGYISSLILHGSLGIPKENIYMCKHSENWQKHAYLSDIEAKLATGEIDHLIFADYFIKEEDYNYFLNLYSIHNFKVTIIDHHPTNEGLVAIFKDYFNNSDEDSKYTNEPNVEIIFDTRYSAALLCYLKYVVKLTKEELDNQAILEQALKTVPEFVIMVHENDTWQFNTPKSKEVGVALNTIIRSKAPIASPYDIKCENGYNIFSEKVFLKVLSEDNYNAIKGDCLTWNPEETLMKALISYGESILSTRNSYIDTVKQTATVHEITIDGKVYNVGLVNANSVFTSDIANQLVVDLELDACISWCMDKNKVKVGVRSTYFDTTLITEHFGGGGHKLASGCSFESLEAFTTKLYNHLHGRTLVINTK